MKMSWGVSDYALSKENRTETVDWDTQRLINPHILLCGKSGTGKTFRLRRMVEQLASQGARFHIFDVHGDIEIPGESRVIFSESSRYGYNPLVLNPDVHVGGVRRAINGFLSTLNRTTSRMGDRQAATLRALLLETYNWRRCYENQPRSWSKPEISSDERDALIEAKRFDDLKNYYPTIDDLLALAEKKLKRLYMGVDDTQAGARAMRALDEVNKMTKAVKKAASKLQSAKTEDQAKREREFETASELAINAFKEYVKSIETGTELDDMMKYDSKEIMKGLVDRIRNLAATGIFHPNTPPFDPRSPIWVYDVKSLPDEERRLFVNFRMEHIFRNRIREGTTADVREIIVVDEAHLFLDSDPDNIFNRIAKESRKFGLGLWCSSQSPTHFSQDFFTTVATKVLLGIDSFFWKLCMSQLRIEETDLKFIQPQRTAAIYMDRKGSLQSKFQRVRLPEALGGPAAKAA